mmetsp:Transcript_17957/g.37826  ORF Transcript_17957/g.37826 Transcript_17957/m.37826 type:complete len:101 (-) Transcript_17957:387-689(-)
MGWSIESMLESVAMAVEASRISWRSSSRSFEGWWGHEFGLKIRVYERKGYLVIVYIVVACFEFGSFVSCVVSFLATSGMVSAASPSSFRHFRIAIRVRCN